ncbi:MAG TPA: T9SS type A sorting domain-containing protein [Flavobacteriales bacterium]|nr:T9SS type A sorting domain-containing protein [Flavobacteriales bacterium]HIO68916.1 T9SS type A sorting domain-containing protein [Flavobacteriales bacterium]
MHKTKTTMKSLATPKLVLLIIGLLFANLLKSQPSVTVTTTDVSCNSTCDGTATATVTGGTAPYTYVWDDPAAQSTTTATGLCAGTYTVTVFDADTVTGPGTGSGVINEPAALVVTVVSATDESCNGCCDGSLTVSVVGGVAPYAYLWSNGAQTPSLANLCAGSYCISVTDSNGCLTTICDSIIVSPGCGTFTGSSNKTDPTCGTCDGSAQANITGGILPYTYSWSSGESTSSISGKCPGSYIVTVTDSNLCVYSDSIYLVDSCGGISGLVFDDINGNGVQDTNELGLAGLNVQLLPDSVNSYTNQFGNYSFSVTNLTTYTVVVSLPAQVYYCSGSMILYSTISLPAPPGTYTVTLDSINPISLGNDFGIEPPVVPCGTISGHVWDDTDQDGINDVGETGVGGANIILDNGFMAQTDGNGDYSISVALDSTVSVSMITGNGNISYYCYGNPVTTNTQTYPLAPDDYTVTLTVGSPNSTGNDFGQYYSPIIDAGIYSLWPNGGVIPGYDFFAGMDFKITGAGTCTLRVDFDPYVTFLSASLTPISSGGNFVEWEIVSSGSYFHCMSMYFTLDPATPPGTILDWVATISCDQTDGCPGNDSKSVQTTVAGPNKSWKINLNKMEVFHTGDTLTGEITVGDSTFSYEIGFQNYGTDTIFNMVIRDTLPEHLNIASLSKPFSSHDLKVEITDPNVLVLTFDNVMLTDTGTSYMNSYGFVQFNIRMNPDLPPGTVIQNSAAIYFDYEDPIYTDTVGNTIVQSNSMSAGGGHDVSVMVYPNPFSIFTNFEFKGLTDRSSLRMEIYDVVGQQIKVVENLRASGFILDRSELANGIYIYKLTDNRGNNLIASGKLVVN